MYPVFLPKRVSDLGDLYCIDSELFHFHSIIQSLKLNIYLFVQILILMWVSIQVCFAFKLFTVLWIFIMLLLFYIETILRNACKQGWLKICIILKTIPPYVLYHFTMLNIYLIVPIFIFFEFLFMALLLYVIHIAI